MFLHSHRMVFMFRSWCCSSVFISILKIFKSLQNYWHRVTYITSFVKRRDRRSLGHTMNFCPNLVQYRFKNMYQKETFTYLVYKLRRVEGEANFISSVSKVVKRLRWRQYDPAIIERTIGLVFGPFTVLYRSFLKRCTLTNKLKTVPVGTVWRVLSKPLQRRQGTEHSPPLIVSQDSISHWTWARLQIGGAQPSNNLTDITRFIWYF